MAVKFQGGKAIPQQQQTVPGHMQTNLGEGISKVEHLVSVGGDSGFTREEMQKLRQAAKLLREVQNTMKRY